MFKQQHNSKLNGKFAESCHEMGVPDFRYDAVERERDAATMVVEIHRGCHLRGSSTKAAAAVVVLDEAESRRFNADVCFGCRNLFVAGINMRVRIEYGRSKRKEKEQGERARARHRRDRKKDRAVVYECLVCGVCAVFRHSLLSAGETASRRRSCAGHLPLNTLPALAPVPTPTPTPSATRQELGADAETAAQPGGRKKKKKKRKGGLSELLAQKRQREQDGDGDGDALLAALLT